MRYRYTKIIQLVLVGLFFVSYFADDLYTASSPLHHLPWLFPVLQILCAAAIVIVDRTNKCPNCHKDLGYTHKGICPHCQEQLF